MRSPPCLGRILPPFLIGIGVACAANAGSYFVLSTGHGVMTVFDGVLRVGCPFVMFEQGGIDGHSDFSWLAVSGNLLVALCFSSLIASFWHFIQSRPSSPQRP